jgi:hypothetical protein
MDKLAIFGSRTLFGKETERVILAEIEKHNPKVIITAAEPQGVCLMAKEIAAKLSIPLKVFFADNNKYAAGKYEHRSKEVLKDCDHCIFVHDGISKGTKNEIQVAKKLGKEFTYHLIKEDIEVYSEWQLEFTENSPINA